MYEATSTHALPLTNSLITLFLHAFTVSRPQLASKHTRLQLATRPGRHPAATDEGGEVQSTSDRPATNHRLYSHIETNPRKTHTGLKCLKKKKNWSTTGHTDIQYVSWTFYFTSIYILRVLHERFSWDKQCKKLCDKECNKFKVPVLLWKGGRSACKRASHRTL